MQLIALGADVINLDRVSVLDIDRGPAPGSFLVRVLTDTNQPVIEIVVPQQTFNALINLVPVQLRLPGQE
jgi:hypothetical protein